jgi:hypothetical protein
MVSKKADRLSSLSHFIKRIKKVCGIILEGIKSEEK